MFKFFALVVLLCANSVLSQKTEDPFDELHNLLNEAEISHEYTDTALFFDAVYKLIGLDLIKLIADNGYDEGIFQKFMNERNSKRPKSPKVAVWQLESYILKLGPDPKKVAKLILELTPEATNLGESIWKFSSIGDFTDFCRKDNLQNLQAVVNSVGNIKKDFFEIPDRNNRVYRFLGQLRHSIPKLGLNPKDPIDKSRENSVVDTREDSFELPDGTNRVYRFLRQLGHLIPKLGPNPRDPIDESGEQKDPIDELHDFLEAAEVSQEELEDTVNIFMAVNSLKELGLVNLVAFDGGDEKSLQCFMEIWNSLVSTSGEVEIYHLQYFISRLGPNPKKAATMIRNLTPEAANLGLLISELDAGNGSCDLPDNMKKLGMVEDAVYEIRDDFFDKPNHNNRVYHFLRSFRVKIAQRPWVI